MKSCASNRKGHPLAARIKRLMQKDDEVGRIASVTPILISTNGVPPLFPTLSVSIQLSYLYRSSSGALSEENMHERNRLRQKQEFPNYISFSPVSHSFVQAPFV